MNRRYSPVPFEGPRDLPQIYNDPGYGYDSGEEGIFGENQLREYWRVIVKYRRVIGGIFILSIISSLLYAFTRTPLFTAVARVEISSYQPVLGSTRIDDVLTEKSREANYLETMIAGIKSPSLADRVLADGRVGTLISGVKGDAKDPEVKTSSGIGGYNFPLRSLNEYLDLVGVEPIRRTNLVDIKITLPDPRSAAEIANKHAATYVEYVREGRVEPQARRLQFLRAQADELREKVSDLQRERTEYAEANSIVAVNKDENITVQKMSQLNRLLTDATAKRIEAENLYKEAEGGGKSVGAGFEDASTQAMRSQLASLEAEYQQLSQKFTSSYPKMVQLRSQIEGLISSITGQQSQIVVGLRAKAGASKQEENRLREELDRQQSQAFELSRREVRYNELEREFTSSRELLENVLREINQASITVEGGASNVMVRDPAIAPDSPSFPRKKVMLMVGAFLGLGLGFGLAFLLNYLDNTIRTPEDVQAYLHLPTLGVVPSFELEITDSSKLGSNGRDRPDGDKEAVDPTQHKVTANNLPVKNNPGELVFLKEPKSLASEAFRTIRTGILLSQAGEPPKTILVSSAQSSEGKTTSALNLAASLASAGGRVVVVDADLRRPSVLRALGKEDDEVSGLVEFITGQVSLEEVIREDLIKRITIIPSGRIPPNPAELLGSLEMASLIDTLAERFDYVIIDSPPVLPVTDSVILSRYVDGVVLVVKGGFTPRKVVRDARDRLQAVGARFLGCILNDIDVTSGDYYYYNRYYYSYYREELDEGSAQIQA